MHKTNRTNPMSCKLLNFVLILLCLGVAESAVLTESNRIQCEHYNEKNCTAYGDCTTTTEYCKSDSEKQSCYVLWSVDETTGDSHIKMKGCFTEMHECNQTTCITNSERNKNLHFCCCKTSMCNTDQKYIPTTTEAATQIPKESMDDQGMGLICLIGLIVSLAMISVTAAVYVLYCRKRFKQDRINETPTNGGEDGNTSPLLDHLPIKMLGLIASGRFGDVWQGKLHNQDVAIKKIRNAEKESWTTEVEIYKLPRMRHPNILEFLGSEKHIPEYWLISAYHHNGSLYNYLTSHTLTWFELCKIAESMSRGLMYLHEEIPASKTEKIKPSIAHRDFKSKNVLLKADLTACIADFGLAIIFEPGKPCGDTHGQVGTRRYMAPEILEGAINFNRDAFLRIDVYALGLVLWEMVSRCDINGPVGNFQLPFEKEIGQHPTLDQMQENVVMKKCRPKILKKWREHSGLSVFCDTMEECWDHDAEARLSSSCVMERLGQLNKYPIKQLLIENNTNCDDDAKETTNFL